MKEISDAIHNTYGHRVRVRACGICIQEDRVLMIRHKGLSKKGYFWSPPGGEIHFGETVEQCLEREFLEETGLVIQPNQYLFTNEVIATPLHAIEVFFLVTRKRGKLQLGTDPEMRDNQMITNLKYMSAEDIIAEKGEQLHNIFNYCSDINTLLELRGYFKFDNKTRY